MKKVQSGQGATDVGAHLTNHGVRWHEEVRDQYSTPESVVVEPSRKLETEEDANYQRPEQVTLLGDLDTPISPRLTEMGEPIPVKLSFEEGPRSRPPSLENVRIFIDKALHSDTDNTVAIALLGVSLGEVVRYLEVTRQQEAQ